MEDQLRLILNKLETIENKIDNIIVRLEVCEDSCKNMDEHIHFVENTYDALRAPLGYVKDKFNFLTGNEKETLPIITSQKKLNNSIDHVP